jgi:hypothetical protein
LQVLRRTEGDRRLVSHHLDKQVKIPPAAYSKMRRIYTDGVTLIVIPDFMGKRKDGKLKLYCPDGRLLLRGAKQANDQKL